MLARIPTFFLQMKYVRALVQLNICLGIIVVCLRFIKLIRGKHNFRKQAWRLLIISEKLIHPGDWEEEHFALTSLFILKCKHTFP